MFLPLLLAACSEYNFIKHDDVDTGTLTEDSASVDTASTDTITIVPASFPLGQMLASCLFEPAICPETRSDCSGGTATAKTEIVNRLVRSAGELPPRFIQYDCRTYT